MQEMSDHSIQFRITRKATMSAGNQNKPNKKTHTQALIISAIVEYTEFLVSNFLPVVAQNKESPEHGTLRNPVQRPHNPAVDIRRRHGEPGDDGDVSDDVAHRPPRVLHPAVLGYCRPDLGQPEGRRAARIETVIFLFRILIDDNRGNIIVLEFEVRDLQWSTDAEGPVAGDGPARVDAAAGGGEGWEGPDPVRAVGDGPDPGDGYDGR